MADLIVEVVVAKALAGDIRFIRLIFDRIDGPVTRQAVEPAPAAGRIVIEPAGAVPLTPGGEPRRSIPRPARRRAV